MATQINTPIPPNPIGENFAWRDWFQKLSNKVYGSMANQDSGSVNITGGYINGTVIGNTTPSTGKFTTLDATTTRTANLLVDSGTDGQILVGRTSDHAFLPIDLEFRRILYDKCILHNHKILSDFWHVFRNYRIYRPDQ